MSDQPAKVYRLAAVAKELNVGREHLIETLTTKGFKVDNNPNGKLSEEMYMVLLKEYNADAAAKLEATSIKLDKPHPSLIETKKEETFISHRKKEDEIPDIVIKGTIAHLNPPPAPKAEPKKKETPAPAVVPQPEPEPVKAPAPEKVVEKIERKRVTIEGPKVVGKLENLDEIPSDTKPTEDKKKAVKKKKKEDAEVAPELNFEAPAVVEKAAEPVTPPTPKAPPAPMVPEKIIPTIQEVQFHQPTNTTPEPEKIETRLVELTGPKVVNKIDLSKFDEPKPAEKTEAEKQSEQDKKKRKRIQIKQPERFKPTYENQSGGGAPSGPRPGAKTVILNNNAGGGKRRNDAVVPSEQEIQDKIKKTLAELSGGSQKSSKSKYRREKRAAHAEEAMEAKESGDNSVLQVTEFISVSELATLMNKSATDIIMACMSLGIIVSINQRLDAELIEVVASEFGFKAQFISAEEEYGFDDEADSPEDLKPRPPIVTIMGHVDHGKTSLLDYIRNANVVAGEAGGITQHIGAYEVTLPNGKEITFLDTPGHEAFTAMRARGAKITDVAVIVVSADDSVMPQTKEAISHAQAANVPIIFAINKIDKDGANPERIKEQLAGMNLLVEDWGGKIQSQEISAKKGLNIDKLLEKILLEAELLELKANPKKPAIGSVIEATLDKGRGFVSTVLVQEGELRVGDMIVAGAQYGRVKAMSDERGKRIEVAGPSTPVQLLGLDGAPQAGEKFKAFEDEQEAKELALKRQQIIREQGYRTKKHITLDEIGRRLALGNFKQLNILVKADVDGSVEALSDSLIKLSNAEIQVNVVLKAVGQISESDVLLASASDAIIIGFNVRPSLQARKLAEQENIEIKLYSVIYQAIEELQSAIEGMMMPTMEEKITSNVEIREVFKITNVGTVAGCYVMDGKITRNTAIRIIRDGIVVYSGELASLKRFKDDAKEVQAGMECGLNIRNFNDIKVGDIIEGYEQVEVKKKI